MSGFLSSESSDEDGKFFDMLFLTEEEQNKISSKEIKANASRKNKSKYALQKMEEAAATYVDYDQVQGSQNGTSDAWVSTSKEPGVEDTVKDYRTELELYRGNEMESSEEGAEKPKKRRSKKKKKKKKKITEKGKKHRDKFLKEVAPKILCNFFKMGRCFKGDNCAYSHTFPKKIRALCKYFLDNTCRKGEDCKYMHSEFPCKYFHTKAMCYARDDCRFSHEPLTEEMSEALYKYLNPKPQPIREEDPQQQRPCLLGDVSEEMAQSEETRQWRQEMSHLKVVNPGFSIEVPPLAEKKEANTEPSGAAKFSFYRETLTGSADVGGDCPPFHLSSTPLQNTHLEDSFRELHLLQPKVEVESEDEDENEWEIAFPESIPSGEQVSVGCFGRENATRVKTGDSPGKLDVHEPTSPSTNFADRSPPKSFPKLPSVMPVCPIPNRMNGFKPLQKDGTSSNFMQSEISRKTPNASEWKPRLGTTLPGEVKMKSGRSPVEQQPSVSAPRPFGQDRFFDVIPKSRPTEIERGASKAKSFEESRYESTLYGERDRNGTKPITPQAKGQNRAKNWLPFQQFFPLKGKTANLYFGRPVYGNESDEIRGRNKDRTNNPLTTQPLGKKQATNCFPFQPFIPQTDKADNPHFGTPYSGNEISSLRPPEAETAFKSPEVNPHFGTPYSGNEISSVRPPEAETAFKSPEVNSHFGTPYSGSEISSLRPPEAETTFKSPEVNPHFGTPDSGNEISSLRPPETETAFRSPEVNPHFGTPDSGNEISSVRPPEAETAFRSPEVDPHFGTPYSGNEISSLRPPEAETAFKRPEVNPHFGTPYSGDEISFLRPPEVETASEIPEVPSLPNGIVSGGTVPPETPSVSSEMELGMPLETGIQGVPHNNSMQNPVNKGFQKRPRKKTPGVRKNQMKKNNRNTPKERRPENPWKASMVVPVWPSITAMMIDTEMHVLQYGGNYTPEQIKKHMPKYKEILEELADPDHPLNRKSKQSKRGSERPKRPIPADSGLAAADREEGKPLAARGAVSLDSRAGVGKGAPKPSLTSRQLLLKTCVKPGKPAVSEEPRGFSRRLFESEAASSGAQRQPRSRFKGNGTPDDIVDHRPVQYSFNRLQTDVQSICSLRPMEGNDVRFLDEPPPPSTPTRRASKRIRLRSLSPSCFKGIEASSPVNSGRCSPRDDDRPPQTRQRSLSLSGADDFDHANVGRSRAGLRSPSPASVGDSGSEVVEGSPSTRYFLRDSWKNPEIRSRETGHRSLSPSVSNDSPSEVARKSPSCPLRDGRKDPGASPRSRLRGPSPAIGNDSTSRALERSPSVSSNRYSLRDGWQNGEMHSPRTRLQSPSPSSASDSSCSSINSYKYPLRSRRQSSEMRVPGSGVRSPVNAGDSRDVDPSASIGSRRTRLQSLSPSREVEGSSSINLNKYSLRNNRQGPETHSPSPSPLRPGDSEDVEEAPSINSGRYSLRNHPRSLERRTGSSKDSALHGRKPPSDAKVCVSDGGVVKSGWSNPSFSYNLRNSSATEKRDGSSPKKTELDPSSGSSSISSEAESRLASHLPRAISDPRMTRLCRERKVRSRPVQNGVAK